MAVQNHKTSPVYVNGFKHGKLNEERDLCALTAAVDQWKKEQAPHIKQEVKLCWPATSQHMCASTS
jgi:hypothetical protein